MMRYHINPKTGNAGPCRATNNCPFGDEKEHYESLALAHEAYENKNKINITRIEYRYDLPETLLDEAMKRIERANRRAERAGIGERFTVDVKHYENETVQDGIAHFEPRVRLMLNTPQVQHQGWNFVGTMTWDKEAGLITRLAPGEELLRRPEAELCDVCKTTRHRTDTYIVQKGDEQLQVGSSCLKRFMGIKPEGLWMLEFTLDEVAERASIAGQDYRQQRVSSREMLGLGLALVRRQGWVSKTMAQESNGERMATAAAVEMLLSNPASTDMQRERDEILSEAQALADAVDKILAHTRSLTPDNDYLHNLHAVSSVDTVTMQNLPLLISSIGVYERAQQKQREQEKRGESNSHWVGTVNDKITSTLTVNEIKEISSYWGVSKLITMRDENDNVLKTFYGGNDEIVVGKVYKTTATVKKHEDWQGEQQTLLGRVKFIDLNPPPPPPSTLDASSPYVHIGNGRELDKTVNGEERRIIREFKKRAGKNNWDSGGNRPIDDGLAKQYEQALDENFDAYRHRHGELDTVQ